MDCSAEDALTPDQAMAHLAAIVESSEDAIISKTLEGCILTWNTGAERVYGYSAGETIGRQMTMLLPDDRPDEEAEILARIGRGERVEHFETVRRTKSGSRIDVSLTISPTRDKAGRITGASHVARNITERKRNEQRLQHMAAIVASSDDAIISKTLDGTILTWNAGAESVYGYREAEALGRHMAMLLPEDRPDEEAEILARIGRGERVEHFETVRRTKNGGRIDVSLTISPTRDSSGRITGASHVARNITERKRIEARLQHLAGIVESSEDAIISKTLEGVILTWNAGAERVYGYNASETIGRQMTMLLPEDRPNEEAEILARIGRGEPVQHFETVRRTKSGKLIDVSLTISPTRNQSGQVTGASHVARNITERKRLEDQLRHTQKLESLGVLAGGVAHDFNNLLTGIMGNASLALDTIPAGNSASGLLRDVIHASERAAALTRQLLAYAGRGSFVIEPVNLSGMIREIASLLQTSITKNVELELKLSDGLPAIMADASQLQQLIMNLVINGAEAIGPRENGKVIASTGVLYADEQFLRDTLGERSELPAGRYVTLEVQDNGSGMDEETLGRIFDPFFTTKFTGRGLGLSAVQGIIRGHRGGMAVESQPGRGTTFRVLFPATSEVIAPAPRQPTPSGSTGEWILVVDDEEVVRRTAKAMLERRGYNVILAEDGQRAVELFRGLADTIAAVLLDMTMPVMNGEEAFRQLKQIKPDVTVILSSGYNQAEAIRRFSGLGLAGFMQKPYAATALTEKIGAILKAASSRR